MAGTLSSTWIGALVLGNQALFSGLGIISVAGIWGAVGGIGASVTGGVGAALSAVGLGGVASYLGIAPVATFLGLTPVGWAITGTATVVAGTLGYYFTRRTMRRLNEERQKGGLEPITIMQILREVRQLEAQSMSDILQRLSRERDDVQVSASGEEAIVNGQAFSVGKLKYVISDDGSEEIVFITRTGRRQRILLVKPAKSNLASA
ncbi:MULTISPECIES: hypothetical protein [unclassified Paracoccus (in: a-proteobacteria)]|uniref:hypothetical protein n=1 Tax=unclassified Paracoccus (in: a-proteobacteria) TaxID=2688777 RepID=UPI0012B298CB|nr:MULTISPECIES: hypothetical protein [unclassified Paracoccus (in: a-proteobacteria)]UXU74569.1 hypothetical protein GB879_011820 [Paracoccus sp. SMMA_5]UXU80463.1 hypothetical protein GB880_011805 [Paracoccus sp. SMMA_5_TC]